MRNRIPLIASLVGVSLACGNGGSSGSYGAPADGGSEASVCNAGCDAELLLPERPDGHAGVHHHRLGRLRLHLARLRIQRTPGVR